GCPKDQVEMNRSRYSTASRSVAHASSQLTVALPCCLLAFMFAVWAPGVNAQVSTPAPTFTTGQLIDAIVASHTRMRQLQGLEVDYRLDQEEFEPKSNVTWAWPWIEFRNRIKPSQPGKIF